MVVVVLLYTLYSILYTLYSILYTLYSILYARHGELQRPDAACQDLTGHSHESISVSESPTPDMRSKGGGGGGGRRVVMTPMIQSASVSGRGVQGGGGVEATCRALVGLASAGLGDESGSGSEPEDVSEPQGIEYKV